LTPIQEFELILFFAELDSSLLGVWWRRGIENRTVFDLNRKENDAVRKTSKP